MTQSGDKKAPDWERIELDYRAGVLSLREIADGSGVSHVTISKRAKREGWDRDLSGKIKAKADALVNKRMVNSEVNKVSENEIVLTNAEEIANVRLGHRKDVLRLRNLIMQLTGELEAPVDDISLQHKIDCAKKLAEAQKTLIGMEREAYNIGTEAVKSSSQTLSDLMDELTGEG